MAKTIIIIGAGQAAAQAIQTLRAKGSDERIILIGDEPYLPYDRPPLSKGLLAGDIELERLYFKKPAFYEDKAVDLHLRTRVEAIDRAAKTVTLSDGAPLAYDDLIIATGARVRKLSLPGSDLKGIHYLRSIDDVLGIRDEMTPGSRLAIVGAGYIGLEVAAVARKLGVEVTVLEALDRVMTRVVAAPVSHFYEGVHREAGVDLRLGIGISGFEGGAGDGGRVTSVRLADGSHLPCDLAIVGIGVVPNVELAEDAGLEVGNGIVVDDCARTSDPHIYAAGDCTNHPNALLGARIRLESVQNAVSQGKAAALAILGMAESYAEVPWFWSDQYDLKLQIAGLWEPTDELVLRGDPQSRKFSAVYVRDGAIAAINVVNNLKDFLPAKKLIGERRVVDRAKLSDPEISLKDL
ncbi:NAD(P)/FAD-dependent oxidoreductase [Govanella unica]|uniref:FAD-dependent oxidoreductase n=1 Tax=Govanella unica TaxID=2975056 RepID=A0A9X3TZB1_9PROT|nr:FAD-dependent oxidoreductase [Govania unica]MDA5194500.1 FAD-dependent oxidoreductase [Govania unica]